MEVAIRRIDPSDRDGAPFLPSERLTLDQALTGFTSGTAFVNHDEAGGTLAVGARADFAVLDQDLYVLDGKVADASVVCTVASGEVVYGDADVLSRVWADRVSSRQRTRSSAAAARPAPRTRPPGSRPAS